MNMWMLILVSAIGPGEVTTEPITHYQFLPECEMAAKGRQIMLPSAEKLAKKYICVQTPEVKNNDKS